MGRGLEAVSARGAPASSGIAGTGYRFNHYDERCEGCSMQDPAYELPRISLLGR
jgi:hypothetical protein